MISLAALSADNSFRALENRVVVASSRTPEPIVLQYNDFACHEESCLAFITSPRLIFEPSRGVTDGEMCIA